MWEGNEYVYTKGTLKGIARAYDDIYEGIPKIWGAAITDPLSIAEYKADFDKALDGIGRGHWRGEVEDAVFSDFRHFGRLQRIIIADIYGVSDYELERLGFHHISRVKGLAYKWMINFLNGVPFRGSQTRFVAKPLDKGVQ